jgi:phosphate transport system protein
MLEEKITTLRRELIEYASLVERMIEKSIAGLLRREKELFSEVIETEEPRANDFEIHLDEMCTTMIAQYQPKAKDLRTILMIYKANNDLERMADHAVNISEHGLYLVGHPQVKPLIDIPRMADIVVEMVHSSINSFVTEDPSLAWSVFKKDDEVDALLQQIIRELITHMIVNSKTIERAIRLIAISRDLERIADLSTNISEDVIFITEGKVVKHHKNTLNGQREKT